ncbi:MAG: tetratricopeptide repeat protein [Gemmataceae bacterium]
MTDSPPSPRARLSPRLLRLLVAGGLVLVLAGLAASARRWYLRPEVPTIALEGADPQVADAIRTAREGVLKARWSSEAWGQLGMVLLGNKFEEDAVEPLARAGQFDPTEPRWPYLRGIALVGREPDQAIEAFRQAARLCRDRAECSAAHLRLAETLAANGLPDEAEAHFRDVGGSLAVCADYGLGTLAAGRGDLARARRLLQRCLASPLTRQKASAQLQAVARRLGEKIDPPPPLPPDAPWPDLFLIPCLNLATGKQPRLQLIARLEGQGDEGRALQALRDLARDYPDAETLLALGIKLGRLGQFAESEQVLRRCLEQQPDLVRAQYYLSLALFAQGEALQQQKQPEAAARYDEAARWAERAIQAMPQHGEAHFQLGLTHWARGRRPEAIAAFRAAATARPDLVDAHLWLGRALAESGQKEEAARHLRDAVRHAAPGDDRPRKALEQLGLRPAP